MKFFFRYLKILFNDPKWLVAKSPFGQFLSDETFVVIKYKYLTGRRLDLISPKGYNEKIQWLKLNYHLPILTQLVDKFEVKSYVKNIIGEQYVIQNYGVWDSFDQINFEDLPSQFVLKTTHDSGGVVICENKDDLDLQYAKKKLNSHLASNHFIKNREWAYKNVKPRIIAEKYFVNNNEFGIKEELTDYKFFCFHGKPKFVQISTGRFKTELMHTFYDMSFQKMNVSKSGKKSNKNLQKPKNFTKMIEFAEKLSNGFPHVRVDFYNINGEIYFGEYTFYPAGGFSLFKPLNWENEIGSWINIKQLNRNNV